MITPAEIRKKAERRYRVCLRTCLEPDADLFPLNISYRRPGKNDPHPEVIAWVQALREGAKETLGYGYRIEWADRRSRQFGSNRFPDRIVFDSPGDLLRFIGKMKEFQRYDKGVRRVREQYPVLEPWLKREVAVMEEIVAIPGAVEGLLGVCSYLESHPRCGLFARQLPVPVDTKFVERHRRVLRKWLDLILPPSAIDPLEDHFERRFGLGYPEPLVEMRVLDGFGEHRALPLSVAASWNPPGELEKVIITENRVNFLTLPDRPRGLALCGMGNSVNLFRFLDWLPHRDIFYWGDIDAHGFEILGRLRKFFPELKSVFMDHETLEAHRGQVGRGKPFRNQAMGKFSDEELVLFEKCIAENVRLEQEKIPQDWVEKNLVLD